MRSVMSKTCAVQNTGFIDLSSVRLWYDHHEIWKQRTRSYLEVEIRWPFPLRVPSKRLDRTQEPERRSRWILQQLWTILSGGESLAGHGADQGKVKIQGMVSPLASFFSFLLPLGLFSLAVCREQATLAKPLTCISAPRAQKELKPLSHFFAICCKFKAARDKAFFMERVKKEKTTCDLTCWFPENRTLQGAEGKGTEAGGGTEVCNKDLSFSFQEVFKPAAPWGHHWNFFSLKGPWSQPLYGSVWSLSPLGFFLESSGTMYKARIKALQSCFQKELILKETWSIA